MEKFEIDTWKARIDKMVPAHMAFVYRFCSVNHPIFKSENEELYDYFMDRFADLGGMTPELSKRIGWG